MKTAHIFAAAALCGLVLSLGVNANAQSRPGYATVLRIQGQARYSTGDNAWHPLAVGQTLGVGAVIQTSADSAVDVALGDKTSQRIALESQKGAPIVGTDAIGLPSFTRSHNVMAASNAVRMYGDTVLAFNKLQTSDTGVDALTDTELDLRQGTIFGSVKKLSSASNFVVKMPNAAAAVRGTTFVLSSAGVITVIDGSCVESAIVHGQTITQVVNAGEKFDPATGLVTKLTPEEIWVAEQTAVQVVTVPGVVSFAADVTTVNVSPTIAAGTPPPPSDGDD